MLSPIAVTPQIQKTLFVSNGLGQATPAHTLSQWKSKAVTKKSKVVTELGLALYPIVRHHRLPGFFPLAKGEEDGTFVFQEMTNNFLCIDLPAAFRGTTHLDAIRAELQKPANEAIDRGPHFPVLDFSKCWGEPTPSEPEFNDAGSD